MFVALLQASSGVVAATPYAVVTLVELPDDVARVTPGGPTTKESLHNTCADVTPQLQRPAQVGVNLISICSATGKRAFAAEQRMLSMPR